MPKREQLFNRPDPYRWTEGQARLENQQRGRLSRGSRAVITQILSKISEETLGPGENLEVEIGHKQCDLAAIQAHLAEHHHIQGIFLEKNGAVLTVFFNPSA